MTHTSRTCMGNSFTVREGDDFLFEIKEKQLNQTGRIKLSQYPSFSKMELIFEFKPFANQLEDLYRVTHKWEDLFKG